MGHNYRQSLIPSNSRPSSRSMAAASCSEEHWVETSNVVGTDRRCNHIEESRSRCCEPEAAAGTDYDGANIQGVASLPASGQK